MKIIKPGNPQHHTISCTACEAQLEIEPSDVLRHTTTVGQFDRTQIEYMATCGSCQSPIRLVGEEADKWVRAHRLKILDAPSPPPAPGTTFQNK